MTSDAPEKTLNSRQNQFLKKELPQIFKTMELLKIGKDTLLEYYDEFRRNSDEE